MNDNAMKNNLATQTEFPSKMTDLSSSKLSFLVSRDEEQYSSAILKIAIDNIRQCLKDKKSLMEIDFPVSRKSDLGASATLDMTVKFTVKLADQFKEFRNEVWVVLPDGKEARSLREQKKSEAYTICSIDSYPRAVTPKLILIVNPGFNIDEYINIPKIRETIRNNDDFTNDVPTVIINGNLSRLRNGYYPAIFYPNLYKVSKSYYSDVDPVVSIVPIPLQGDRFAAFIMKTYSSLWQLLVKSPRDSTGLEIIQSSDKEFQPNTAWKTAKDEYIKRWPSSSMF